MPKLLDQLMGLAYSKLGLLFLKTSQFVPGQTLAAKKLETLEAIYLILSIDAESDVFIHKTSIAGWEIGVPYILDILSDHGLDGKACWLIEFNIRDGLVFSNPPSVKRFVVDHERLINEVKRKRHEFGLHPTVYALEQGRWDYRRPLKDPAFISKVIHLGTQELTSVCRQRPIGCRTSNFHFAHSLAKALESEGYLVDSSCCKGIFNSIIAPNAYFAGETNYQLFNTSESRTKILEIPTTDHIRQEWKGAFSLKYKPRMFKLGNVSKVLFLSAFFHNWEAVTRDGKENPRFKEAFERFIDLAQEENVRIVSFKEAYELFKAERARDF